MKKIVLTLILTFFSALRIAAHDFEVNGLCYNVTGTNTCEVTFRGDTSLNNDYSGRIEIPASVSYGGRSYRVTTIGGWAFQNCADLNSVVIPNTVTSIGKYAFNFCANLSSVEVPNSVNSIEDGAFWGCSSLVSINVPSSLTSIADLVFSGCSSLTSVIIPQSVTTIGRQSFYGSGISSIEIPNGVTAIDGEAFRYCTNLTSIRIPDAVVSLGYGVFSDCSRLTSAVLPAHLVEVPNSFFYGCSRLKTVIIPNTVTSIGAAAFSCCYSLKSINIPNPLTVIRADSFACCDFESISAILNGANTIEESAFNGCRNLQSVVIPNSVKAINGWAFAWCSNLSSIVISNSVTMIGDYVFYNAPLKDIVNLAKVPQSVGENTFYTLSSDVRLHVLPGCANAYRNAAGWNGFAEVTEDADKYFAPLTTLHFEEKYLTMAAGTTLRPTYTLLPENATNKQLRWMSANEEVATVTQDGVVTAVGPGESTIVALATDGSNKAAYFILTVVGSNGESKLDGMKIVNLDGKSELSVGDQARLTSELYYSGQSAGPSNGRAKAPAGTTANVTWKSSNPSVATVSSDGLVTAVGDGLATITATTNQKGAASATYILNVHEKAANPNVSATAQLLVWKSYQNKHHKETAYGVTADGEAELLIALNETTGVIGGVIPTLKAFDANGKALSLRKDEMGVISEPMKAYEGVPGFVYKAPRNINVAALGSNRYYNVEVWCDMMVGTKQESRKICTIKVYRPALFMSHGLDSNPQDAWGYIDNYLKKHNYWPYTFVNYKASNKKAFAVNAYEKRVVQEEIERFSDELFKSYGINSAAYDLAGHSMGGILSRLYAQQGTKHAASVHKIITLNTPHWGSKIAVAAELLKEELWWPDCLMAVADLSCDSQPVSDLSATCKNLYGVPVHAMCSYIDARDYHEMEVQKSKKQSVIGKAQALAEEMSFVAGSEAWLKLSEIYGEYKWDVFVGYASQRAGLEKPFITVKHEPYKGSNITDSRAFHASMHDWDEYVDEFYNLLNARTDCGSFCFDGYKPIDEYYHSSIWQDFDMTPASKRRQTPQRAAGIDSRIAMQADWSMENDSIYINIAVEHSDDIVANLVYASLDDDMALCNSMLDEYIFMIPKSYAGELCFHIVGRTEDNATVTDELTLDIPKLGIMESLNFAYDAPTMVVGQTKGFTTLGTWKDEETRSVAARLTSSDETIAEVQDGRVVALAPGTFTLTAEYGDQSAYMDVEVLPSTLSIITDDDEEQTPPPVRKVFGDLNADRVVDEGDVQIMEHILLHDINDADADINGDGTNTIADMAILVGVVNGTFEEHPYVDLGLPSRTLWATCNIGAHSPAEAGDLFAWGETETKSVYRTTNYFDSNDNCQTYLDYSAAGKRELSLMHDAATAHWGIEWSIPSAAQWQELMDNATWQYVDGLAHVVGPNGNAIDFVVQSTCTVDADALAADNVVTYWASSLTDDDHKASSVIFRLVQKGGREGSSTFVEPELDGYNRYIGQMIRPVRREVVIECEPEIPE